MPGVVVAVFGPVTGRVLPGEVIPWGCPPGRPVALGEPVRDGSVVDLPSVVPPGSAAVWMGAGVGPPTGGAFKAPLLTRVTTAPGNAALAGAAPPPER
jgi:hypothetical protein